MSNKNKYKEKSEELAILTNLYGNILHTEIIYSVAQTQKWDMQKTIKILSEMIHNVSPNSPTQLLEQNSNLGRNDVVIENDIQLPRVSSISYSTSIMRKPKNHLSSNTGAKKKQIQAKPKSKKEMEIERVRAEILQGYLVLVILRGLPGSGKTQLAKYLASSTVPGDYRTFVYSTDDYFISGGTYKHNPALLPEAHAWNQRRVSEAAQLGMSPIIIDNTNIQTWEMRPYATIAVQFGYQLEMLEPNTAWSNNIVQLSQKNVHAVPKHKIKEMQQRFENRTVDQLFSMFSLRYSPDKRPPQLRKHPPFRSKIIHKPTCNNVQNIPKLKRPKKRAQRFQNINECDATALNDLRTIHSKSVEQLSDTWESDTESTWENVVDDTIQKDHVSSDMEYVLVNPDQTLIYQKQHIDSELLVQDLINFNDSDSKIENTENSTLNTNNNQNIIERILDQKGSLLDEDNILSEVCNKDLLNEVKIKVDSSQDKKEEKNISYTQRLLSFQNNWNLLTIPQTIVDSFLHKNQRHVEIAVKNISTNTNSIEFIGNNHSCGKILYGKARNISNASNLNTCTVPPKILMLEKGTMTHLETTEQNTSKQLINDLCTLLNLFPEVEEDVLKDIYDKCNQDVNWTVDLLLENGAQASATGEGDRQPKHVQNESTQSINDLLEDIPNELLPKNHKIKNKTIDDPLKKHLEEQFRIGDEHYSKHVLNIRKKRYGLNDPAPIGESSTFVPNSTEEQDDTESEVEDTEFENELMEFNFGRGFVEQLEKAFGNTNTDYLNDLLPVMQIPLNLARQFHALWMESVYSQMETKLNIIQEIERQDAELAKRLQDEETHALQKQQNPQEVPSLKEIMDMEIALAVYRSDQDNWRKETPDDLASIMTRQKLFEAFPQQDRDVLVEILQAHDNCFEETVLTLFSSIGTTENEKLANINGKIVAKNPMDDVAKQKQLLEKAKNDIKKPDDLDLAQGIDYDSEDEIDICKKGANFYRERAAHHLDMRQKSFQKANDYIRKGQHAVASYYSEIAKLYTQKYEIENNRAASAFLSEHSLGHKDERVLDLHYLYVREAEQALALFLDAQILKLRQVKRSRETLFIITGRGKNSFGGRAQIKPAIKKRLKDRNLKFSEMNPGSLKVTINKNSLLTNDLKWD